MNGSLDMLAFDGIRMSMTGLDSELSVDRIGESLLERLAAGNSSSSLDRRRNRGLLFQTSGSASLGYDMDMGMGGVGGMGMGVSDDSKLSDDDALLPFNQFISDVIDSPDLHHHSYPTRLFDPPHPS
jgi:hypothetical protein